MTGALTTAGQEIPGRQRQSKSNGMEVSQPNPDTSRSQKDLPTQCQGSDWVCAHKLSLCALAFLVADYGFLHGYEIRALQTRSTIIWKSIQDCSRRWTVRNESNRRWAGSKCAHR